MNIDRRFFDFSFTVAGIANEPANNPTEGTQYIVGSSPIGAFEGATVNAIARYENSAWKFITPRVGKLEVLNIETRKILKFDGVQWIVTASLDKYLDLETYYHTLTEEEIQNKTFKIGNFSLSRVYEYVALFLNGIKQELWSDFSISNTATSGGGLDFKFTVHDDGERIKTIYVNWRSGFNDLDIRPGDIVTLQVIAY